MVTNLARFAWLVLHHPRAWRFIDEGFGIAARYKRAKRYWDPHLKLSKEYLVKELTRLSPHSITVLGSGALNDFPELESLPKSITEIRLVDGNPAHLQIYRQLESACRQRDITLTWRFEDLMQIPDQELADELVISLNLISQLALMNKRQSSPAAFHLAQLGQIAGRAAILIGDRSWLSYLPDSTSWDEQLACPDVSRWEIPNMQESQHEQWFWHVAPYGLERSDCGLIHDVHAQTFERN